MLKIIECNKKGNIKCGFIHTKSSFYDKNEETFGLIHASLFEENNFFECKADKLHFCSPELFNQLLSKDNNYTIVDESKSDIFSLGMLILFIINQYNKDFKMSNIYDRENAIIEIREINLLL